MNYDNFDILIIENRVIITGSEQGVQTPEILDLANDIPNLQDILEQIARNQVDAPPLEEFGAQLTGALFKGRIRDCFYQSLAYAEGRGHGLRVRLQTQAERIQSIPWEFMKIERLDQPFAISPKVTLCRYPVTSQWIVPLRVIPPMRILVMISNPYYDLDVDKEWDSILLATEPLRDDGRIQVDMVDATRDSLLDKLREPDGYHVFHFIGHGRFDRERQESLLAFKDGTIDAFAFSAFFLNNDKPRLIVLNACETAMSMAQRLTMWGVPAVVAMQYNIRDEAAIAFSRSFYEALVRNATLDAAVSEGRRAIFTGIGRDVRDWGTPVLFTRSSDGRVIYIGLDDPYTTLLKALLGWKDLHNHLQNIDSSLASVEDEVYREDGPDIRAIRIRWDDCRRHILQLVDFATGVKRIGRPYNEDESGEIVGEKWVVEPVMIQRDIDQVLASVRPGKRLTEEQRSKLGELISKLKLNISGHFVTADGDLRRAAEELRDLHDSRRRL